jgi:3-deoxy-D-manno-octulosonic-acid transferase
MEKYTVSFKNLKVVVWAKNHEQAMRKALRKETKQPKTIALISTCLKEGDSEEDEYMFHVDYMKNNGYFKGLEFEPLN